MKGSNRVKFLRTGGGIECSRKGSYNFKNISHCKKLKIWNILWLLIWGQNWVAGVRRLARPSYLAERRQVAQLLFLVKLNPECLSYEKVTKQLKHYLYFCDFFSFFVVSFRKDSLVLTAFSNCGRNHHMQWCLIVPKTPCAILGRLVEPWFLFYQDLTEPKFPSHSQT